MWRCFSRQKVVYLFFQEPHGLGLGQVPSELFCRRSTTSCRSTSLGAAFIIEAAESSEQERHTTDGDVGDGMPWGPEAVRL